jgi:hypothetical protein
MFSAFARFPDPACGYAVPAGAAFAISNHPQHASNAGHVAHRDRPRPFCRCRPDPATGKFVCGWEIDDAEAASAGEPVSGGHEGQVFALVAFCQMPGLAMRTPER